MRGQHGGVAAPKVVVVAAVILCADAFQSMYAQMVCGLCQRLDVLRVGAVFASGLLRAIRFLQLHWEQLADDIECGSLAPRVADPSVREAVAAVLRRPDAGMARAEDVGDRDWAQVGDSAPPIPLVQRQRGEQTKVPRRRRALARALGPGEGSCGGAALRVAAWEEGDEQIKIGQFGLFFVSLTVLGRLKL
jgi:hypothetical protein